MQVIDGAENCIFGIWAVSLEDFEVLFPGDGQDMEFAEDFLEREPERAQEIWDRVWLCPVDKKTVAGIQGTLFCGLAARKKYFPTKREGEGDHFPEQRP